VPRRSTAGWAALGCLLLLLSQAACAGRPDQWDRIRTAGVLRVGMDASFPPFEMIAAGGALQGFDVDLARELGCRLGLEVTFTANLPYDGLYDALAVGQVDLVASALVIDPSRTADFAYSTPYFDAGQVLVVRHGQTGIERMEDLAGQRLAVELGSLGDETARAWSGRLADLSVVQQETAQAALALLAQGGADAALVDHVSALAAGAAALEIVGAPVVEEPLALAMRADDRGLQRAVDRALAAMEADGTLERLLGRWLDGAPDAVGRSPATPGSTWQPCAQPSAALHRSWPLASFVV
jgi:arginine/lysine/histidine/glutamine transport system substrate-binding and permease protein